MRRGGRAATDCSCSSSAAHTCRRWPRRCPHSRGDTPRPDAGGAEGGHRGLPPAPLPSSAPPRPAPDRCPPSVCSRFTQKPRCTSSVFSPAQRTESRRVQTGSAEARHPEGSSSDSLCPSQTRRGFPFSGPSRRPAPGSRTRWQVPGEQRPCPRVTRTAAGGRALRDARAPRLSRQQLALGRARFVVWAYRLCVYRYTHAHAQGKETGLGDLAEVFAFSGRSGSVCTVLALSVNFTM